LQEDILFSGKMLQGFRTSFGHCWLRALCHRFVLQFAGAVDTGSSCGFEQE
jgi:hypothetical protein